MSIATGSFIALVGSSASDDWRVVIGFIAVVIGLVVLPLAVARLTGALEATPMRRTRTSLGNGTARWTRRAPFIPSNW